MTARAATTQTDDVDPQETRIAPSRHSRRHARFLRQRVAIPKRGAGRDRTDRERDDQGVELEHRDQKAVDQADDRGEEQRRKRRPEYGVVLTSRETQDHGARERNDGRNRKIDAARHEHERLADGGDAEKGRQRDDREKCRRQQAARHDNRGDDDQADHRDPDRGEAHLDAPAAKNGRGFWRRIDGGCVYGTLHGVLAAAIGLRAARMFAQTRRIGCKPE